MPQSAIEMLSKFQVELVRKLRHQLCALLLITRGGDLPPSVPTCRGAEKRREHSARCINTSKTRIAHATAVDDDPQENRTESSSGSESTFTWKIPQ